MGGEAILSGTVRMNIADVFNRLELTKGKTMLGSSEIGAWSFVKILDGGVGNGLGPTWADHTGFCFI